MTILDSIYRQRGMTTIGMALVLAVAVFISTITIKLIPVYLEHFNVATALKGLAADPQVGGMTNREIHDGLSNRFSINDISDVDPKDVQVTRDEGHVKSMSLDYEVRVHMFWNIDAVVHFNEEAEVGS